MTTKTYKSDEARLKLRDILDHTINGGETVIERYDKPTAVVVGYTQWQAMKRLQQESIAQARQEVAAGDTITEAEMLTLLKERGLL